ncbi:MAG: S46 family peptidase [Planctomycetia bacterium]|nr:S46 family peptidase [Planctomycetia bacterium]
MNPWFSKRAALAALGVLLMSCTVTHADEGMWLFNNPPLKLLKDRHNFTPTKDWLDHVQQSSVRFNSGGSGSFVSEDGLVMTNHHVGADALQKISTKDKNYLRDGFLAKNRSEEVKCVDLELNVLTSIDDVTDKVNAAVKSGASAEEAFKARRAVMAEIEKAALAGKDPKKSRADVVTLYQGGQYHLYQFQRYTDIRLVFAPEQQIAFFGGDPDNFEYPRYDLDCCFFRVYEDDKPVKLKHWLRWSKSGAKDNELVFVSGHPGRTSRLNTVAELEYMRDKQFPNLMQILNRLEVMLKVYSDRSEENARRAKDELFGIQNSRKARDGGLAGLLDPGLMGRKKTAEQKLREAVAKDPKLKDALPAWDNIAKAQEEIGKVAQRYNLLERGFGFNSTLFSTARTLVRAAEERTKPDGERLREFRSSNEEPLKLQLFSDEPIHDDLEIVKLGDSLTFLCGQLGSTDPLVQKVLAGKSPRQRAAELITGSKLKDVETRKKLYDGGAKAVEASQDPFIALAKLVDQEARDVRKVVETQSELKQQAYGQLAKAKFAVEGTSTYPDATFTLRLAYGTVKGFEENGQKVPFETTYSGLFERSDDHKNQPPFDLPERWVKLRPQLEKDKAFMNTPFNFVCTADIIGGNSGSPVINKEAEVVGLIFDGNIQSLVLDFIYTDDQARAVSVHSAGIIEALRKVYNAGALADELIGKK